MGYEVIGQIFPARVGMNRATLDGIWQGVNFPRASGDEPSGEPSAQAVA